MNSFVQQADELGLARHRFLPSRVVCKDAATRPASGNNSLPRNDQPTTENHSQLTQIAQMFKP